jgi:hypothetical protein
MIESGDEEYSCCAVEFVAGHRYSASRPRASSAYAAFLVGPENYLGVANVEDAAMDSRPDLPFSEACKQLRVMMLLLAAQAALTGDV